MTRESVHRGIDRAMEDIGEEMIRVSLDLHGNPETAFEEHYASARLAGWLEKEGFEVESPVAGMPTAFVGRAGTGGRPRIAFLMEYDALPGIGHACGHNLIAAGGLAAATALRRALPEPEGTILAIGTPGEEGAGGKVYELEAGIFDGVDAALMFHPGVRTWPWRHATATAHLKVAFFGKAAHAAGNPQGGKNALAAMIQFFVALDALRQHIPETCRLHGIITDGGSAPNVVPDYTEASYLVRAVTAEKTLELVERVAACAQGAATATGTRVEVEQDGPLYTERKNNRTIATRVAEYLTLAGEEVEKPVLKGGIGSSDIGNVSLVLPTIHPYVKIAPVGVSGHSEEFREAAASPRGQEAMLHMATSLAKTGADLLMEPDFLERSWEEFRTSGPDFPE
ncbi:MAG: M20 family metallopeptidase, partial [Rubrobacter sp.]